MPFSPARSRRLLLLGLPVLVLAVAGLVGVLVLRDDDSDGEPGGAGVDGEVAVTRLVFAEFGGNADQIFVAPADQPAERTIVATIEHAPGWGIAPAPSMSGSLVAFTVLPPDSRPRRDTPAELYVLDVATGEQTRLAGNADLLARPILEPGGGAVVYRSSGPSGVQSLIRVDIETQTRRSILDVETTFGVFPLAFDADGALLYSRLSANGTDLYRLHEGEPQRLLHATDEIARDWRLSPDGRTISYLAPEEHAERIVHRLHVIELSGAEAEPVATPALGSGSGAGDASGSSGAGEGNAAPGEQFSPVWTPAGDAITVGREAYPETAAGAITFTLSTGTSEALPAPEAGFDAPLGWSPDGRYLAVRSFTGSDAFDPGRESMVLISPGGARATVATDGGAELMFLGWLGGA